MISKNQTFEELEQKIKELEIKLDAFKKVEKNLLIEKQFSESVIKSLPGIFYIFDEQGKFYRWNENSEKVTEYSTEEISNMSPFDFFEKKDKKMVADTIQEVFVKGRSNVEVNIVSKSGKKTPYFFSGAKITIGNDSYLFGMGIDITERKQVEKALLESEEKYRQLSEGTFEAVVWHDKGKIIEANEQYYELFGYKPEELAGKNAILLTATPDSVKLMEERISLGHLGPYEVVGIKKCGTVFPIEIRAKIMRYKGQTARMAAIRDLTDRRRAEGALRESEERYRSLAENSMVGFWQITLEGYTTYINPAMCSMIEIESHEELSGQTYHSFFSPESLEMIDHERATRPGGRGSSYEAEIIGKNGGRRNVMICGAPLLCTEGKLHGYIATFTDITDRKRAEKALKKAHDKLEHRVKKRTRELEIKKNGLEEINTAMKVLLNKREEDKTELEDNVLTNVKELVVPYFEKIKKTKLDDQQEAFLSIIESNLNEIISPFTRKMSLKYLNLTPTEIQIANLIRHGSPTKKIAELMNISPRTVETHRKNIRRKIGLVRKRANLRSHLLSLH